MDGGETLAGKCLDGIEFRDCSLGEAVFNDVNLGHARFHNVNLAGARMDDVNLAGVMIDNANIRGLTIFGYDVGAMIAERLRQDGCHPD